LVVVYGQKTAKVDNVCGYNNYNCDAFMRATSKPPPLALI